MIAWHLAKGKISICCSTSISYVVSVAGARVDKEIRRDPRFAVSPSSMHVHGHGHYYMKLFALEFCLERISQ
jgi:hypothetical protein